MLRRNPRPDEDGAPPMRGRWPVAWKTGTSWGFRDAWSAGVMGRYVLVVWIGEFSGKGNPSFVGIDAAAPLFFRIADALNFARMKEAVPEFRKPAGVSKVSVCAESGDLPNALLPAYRGDLVHPRQVADQGQPTASRGGDGCVDRSTCVPRLIRPVQPACRSSRTRTLPCGLYRANKAGTQVDLSTHPSPPRDAVG